MQTILKMCTSVKIMLSILCGVQLIACQFIIDKKFRHQTVFKGHFYRIHPLVILEEKSGEKSLVQQDKLDKNGMLNLTSEQKVVLYCSGYHNLLAINPGDQLDIFKDKFPKNVKQFYLFPYGSFDKKKLDKIRCLSPSLVTIEKSTEKCGFRERGEVIPLGFNVLYKKDQFLHLYKICFDAKDQMSAIFTSHQLLGSEHLFPENVEVWNVPMTRKSKLLAVSHLVEPYYSRIQEKIFKNCVGPEGTKWRIYSAAVKGMLFVAAPLAPPGDFYYAPLKTAALLFENTVPVFTIIFAHDLNYIQILGRMLALQVPSKSLQVYTGAFGYFKMIDENGFGHNIYLDTEQNGINRRPIPKFLYKIFYNENLKRGIAFVTKNNPFELEADDDFPCRHIGKAFIRRDYFRTNRGKRKTIYCRVDDLLKYNLMKDFPPIDVSAGHLYLNIFDARFQLAANQLPPGILEL